MNEKKLFIVGWFTFLIVGIVAVAWSERACAAEAEWFVMPLAHGSDPSDAGDSDPTFDFAGGGLTVSAKRWEIDLALGRKAVACRRDDCKTSRGGFVAVRWYPGRGRDGGR